MKNIKYVLTFFIIIFVFHVSTVTSFALDVIANIYHGEAKMNGDSFSGKSTVKFEVNPLDTPISIYNTDKGSYQDILAFSYIEMADNDNYQLILNGDNNNRIPFEVKPTVDLPLNIRVTDFSFQNNIIHISWTPVIGATSYKLYLASEKGYKSAAMVESTIQNSISNLEITESGIKYLYIIAYQNFIRVGRSMETRVEDGRIITGTISLPNGELAANNINITVVGWTYICSPNDGTVNNKAADYQNYTEIMIPAGFNSAPYTLSVKAIKKPIICLNVETVLISNPIVSKLTYDAATGEITISGNAPTTEGKVLTIALKNPDENIEYYGQSITNGSGAFENTFVIDPTKTGVYSLRIGGEEITVPIDCIFTVNISPQSDSFWNGYFLGYFINGYDVNYIKAGYYSEEGTISDIENAKRIDVASNNVINRDFNLLMNVEVVDDYGNDTSSASPIISEKKGVINYSGDEDYFRFIPQASGIYIIGILGDADTIACLKDNLGKKILSDDYTEDGVNFAISSYLEEDKTYYIKVKNINNKTGGYILKIKNAGAIVYEKIEFNRENGEVAIGLIPKESIYINAYLFNYSSNNQSVMIIAALYDSNGMVESIKTFKKTLMGNQSNRFSLSLSMPEDVNNHYIKVLAWENISGVKPIIKPIWFKRRKLF